MVQSRLTPLQERILQVLAPFEPHWTLTGGGALVAIHLGHRTTRDLDLFWHGRDRLEGLAREIQDRLVEAGLGVNVLRTSLSFASLEVTDSGERCVVDLVAEPVPPIEQPVKTLFSGREIYVDTPREILTNKLCALLGRAEIRDLKDVKALLEAGGDIEEAVGQAPRKDGGFSPLTLAWVLNQFQVGRLARAEGMSEEESGELESFRAELAERLRDLGDPGAS